MAEEEVKTKTEYTVQDMINFGADKNALEFGKAFDHLAGQKVVDAIQAKRQEVASMMFNGKPPEEVETEVEPETTEQPEEEVVAADTEQEQEEKPVGTEDTV